MMNRFASLLLRIGAGSGVTSFAPYVALAAAVALGCGSNVQVSTSTGSGATGGTGGASTGGAGTGATGGTGGTGGATTSSTGTTGTSLPSCSQDIQNAFFQVPSNLGLAPEPNGNQSAVVLSVAPKSLQLSTGGGKPDLTFAWDGPPLDAVFKPGDMVSVGALEGWDYVAASQVAAVWHGSAPPVPAALPGVPMSKTPPIGLEPAGCSLLWQASMCIEGTNPANLLTLVVGTDKDAVSVPFMQTVTVGAVEVRNIVAIDEPAIMQGANCVDPEQVDIRVSVLAPVGK
jgi:hypothetical protein